MQIKQFITGPLQVNCYLVMDENTKKAFIVDPGGKDKELLNYIKQNDIEVEYIILTHGHGDHICGIEFFKEALPDAIIVANEAERDILNNPRQNHSIMTCGKAIAVDVDKYVLDEDRLKVGDLEIVCLSTPGHTPGGMCFYVNGALFSGDTLFAQSIGRTDFPYSSFDSLKKAIQEKLYVLPEDTKVYPGHMGSTTIGFEKEYNPFV
ncbi:MAG: MBL fold metallo-hydrolase [Clostridiales bacterium]|jgi:hydroxyacylglutathione hydrolase|nr:MBL fold metallo-hydrolase [Clostridiales bacterium]